MGERKADELRPVTIEPFPTAAAGSVIIRQGDTHVLCTASVEKGVPPFLIDRVTGEPRSGWVTAEYAMLPGSTPQRKRRGVDSRGTEIKRLIGRALRAAVDLDAMPGYTVTVDCDVLRADGGTRTAAITGGYVALAQAIRSIGEGGGLPRDPVVAEVAAVSAGVVDGVPTLDLDYPLDSTAEVDLNVAATADGRLIEVQGTGERTTYTREQLDAMLDLAAKGIGELVAVQRVVLNVPRVA